MVETKYLANLKEGDFEEGGLHVFFCVRGPRGHSQVPGTSRDYVSFQTISICARVDQLLVLGMGTPPTFNDGILIMGPYKPLRNWVDEFIPYYIGNVMGVDRPGRTSISNS